MLDNILMYWVLPSLVTMLLIIIITREYKAYPFESSEYDLENWIILIGLSVLYPVGLWFVFMEWIGGE